MGAAPDGPPVDGPASSPTGIGRLSRLEAVFVIGVPLAWAILLVFHPTGDGDDFYPIVKDEVTTWQVVHIGTMILAPCMAGVVLLLLRGLGGTAALVGRCAVVVFAVGFVAWEVLIGVGNGVLVDQVNQLGPDDEAVGAGLVEAFTDSGVLKAFEFVATAAWLVAMIAAGAALVRERGASRLVLVLFVLSAIPTIWHVVPFGQVGLALFIAAALLVLRGQAPAPVSTHGAQPIAA